MQAKKKRRVTRKGPARKKRTPEPVVLTALEERQALLAHHVRMVARGVTNGLFVVGPGGLGKSRVISQTLTEEGVVPVVLNSHCTPLGLYTAMFQHRDNAVLWLDDADACYTNLPILGLLRSALWGQDERVVTYTTSNQLQGVPTSFEFNSRIICTANMIPKRSEPFRAVLSRVDVFELTATNDDVLQLMRAMAGKGFETLKPAICREVIEFIAKAGGTRQLSMRLYESSLRKVMYAVQTGTDWQDLVRSQLDQLGQPDQFRSTDTKSHDLKSMGIAVERHPSNVRLQQEVWQDLTTKSRASFFRVKKQYDEQRQQEQA